MQSKFIFSWHLKKWWIKKCLNICCDADKNGSPFLQLEVWKGTTILSASQQTFDPSYFVMALVPIQYKLYSTKWPEPIWIKVRSWWQILPQHQSTYLGGPESASIEIPPFRPHFIKFSKTVFYEVNLTSQRSHLEVLLISKFGSERGDFKWCRFWAS